MNQKSVINISLIKEKRLEKGFTTEEMSELLGYEGANAYFRKEKGNRKFSLDDVAKISSILKIPIQDIFFANCITEMETDDSPNKTA